MATKQHPPSRGGFFTILRSAESQMTLAFCSSGLLVLLGEQLLSSGSTIDSLSQSLTPREQGQIQITYTVGSIEALPSSAVVLPPHTESFIGWCLSSSMQADQIQGLERETPEEFRRPYPEFLRSSVWGWGGWGCLGPCSVPPVLQMALESNSCFLQFFLALTLTIPSFW